MFRKILKTISDDVKHFAGMMIPLSTGTYCLMYDKDGLGILFAVVMLLYFLHYLQLFLEDVKIIKS